MFLQKQSVFMLEVQKDYRNVSERYEMWKVLTQHYQRVDADQVVPKRKSFRYHQSLKKKWKVAGHITRNRDNSNWSWGREK